MFHNSRAEKEDRVVQCWKPRSRSPVVEVVVRKFGGVCIDVMVTMLMLIYV
jgi:hypothetical protein